MRIGYLGPEGTFSEQAASRLDGELTGFATVHDVVAAVDGGAVDRGVVPIENSLEGGVNATLDALALDFPRVEIVGVPGEKKLDNNKASYTAIFQR